eukprot:3513420-Rhodomonas_salina.1
MSQTVTCTQATDEPEPQATGSVITVKTRVQAFEFNLKATIECWPSAYNCTHTRGTTSICGFIRRSTNWSDWVGQEGMMTQ